MASQTRPFLKTGAALAGAATLVVATPAIAPSLTATPITVASGNYDLTTFSDVLSIPTSEWVNAYFQGYGGIVGPNNPFPLEPYAGWCNGNCVPAGVSAVAYLGLDALINGNGNGWADNGNWSVGAINYLFELDWNFNEFGPAGLSAGVQYVLQTSIGVANPLLATAISVAFLGPLLVTVVYEDALNLLSTSALGVPLVGDYIYGAINAYLGPASDDVNFQFYTPGPTGILNYAIDVLIGNAPPSPVPAEEPAAAVEAASAVAVASDPAVQAVAEVEAATATTEASVSDEPNAVDAAASGAADAESEPTAVGTEAPEAVDTDAAEAAEVVPAVESPVESAADTESEAEVDTAPAVQTAADVKAAAGNAAVDNPRAAAVTAAGSEDATADSPVKTRKTPIRDAIEKVGKTIGSALKGTKADATADAGSSDAD